MQLQMLTRNRRDELKPDTRASTLAKLIAPGCSVGGSVLQRVRKWRRWSLLVQVLAAAAFSFGLLLTTGIWEQTRPLPGPFTHDRGNLYISGPISVCL